MTATAGFLSLGDAFDLWDANWTGWTYGNRKTELHLIGNGTEAGNVVVQEFAKPYRTGTLDFTAPDSTQKDLVRDDEEDSATVTFVDYDGSTCDVTILDFSSSDIGADMWKVTVRLQQLTEPEGP